LCSPLDSPLEIRIVKDDGGVLFPEFECYIFEIGCSGDLGNLASGEGATHEHDLPDVGVCGDGVANYGTLFSKAVTMVDLGDRYDCGWRQRTVSVDDVDDTWRVSRPNRQAW